MLNIIFSAKLFYVPQWQKLYASILKPSVKKHATHMMHTVAILKIVLANVPV